MASNIQFLVNSKLQIIVEDKRYKSNIQDVLDNGIAISIPVNDGEYLTLRKGNTVVGIYFYKNNIYKFNTSVIGRVTDKINMILLAYPKTFTKIQRRSSVRVPILKDIWCISLGDWKEYTEIKKNNGIEHKEHEFFNAISVDLSGDGIKLCAYRECELGEVLQIMIPIKDEVATFIGKIVRKEESNVADKYNYGVSFVDINKNTKEEIIKYLFEIMREHMRVKAREE